LPKMFPIIRNACVPKKFCLMQFEHFATKPEPVTDSLNADPLSY
jgi:hypothetical protein